jgi:hypothetical protein
MALNARPMISVAPPRSGRGFAAKVIWPTGESQNVVYFRERVEALSWLVNEADAWLENHIDEIAPTSATGHARQIDIVEAAEIDVDLIRA